MQSPSLSLLFRSFAEMPRCARGKLAKNFSGLAIFQLASETHLSSSENALTEAHVYINRELAGLIFSGRLRVTRDAVRGRERKVRRNQRFVSCFTTNRRLPLPRLSSVRILRVDERRSRRFVEVIK